MMRKLPVGSVSGLGHAYGKGLYKRVRRSGEGNVLLADSFLRKFLRSRLKQNDNVMS